MEKKDAWFLETKYNMKEILSPFFKAKCIGQKLVQNIIYRVGQGNISKDWSTSNKCIIDVSTHRHIGCCRLLQVGQCNDTVWKDQQIFH